jgi:hypothetical protein
MDDILNILLGCRKPVMHEEQLKSLNTHLHTLYKQTNDVFACVGPELELCQKFKNAYAEIKGLSPCVYPAVADKWEDINCPPPYMMMGKPDPADFCEPHTDLLFPSDYILGNADTLFINEFES